jgi:ABC-type antimicrobial peptide transport system permease subunit
MEQRRRVTTWEQRLFGTTFGSFGVIAFVLALAGVYGVMAYTVARRRREIGLRITLGAAPADIMRLVLGRALLIACAGITIGVTGALALARLLGGLLWEVSTTDPATFIAAPLLLGGAALLASYLPARRATRVEPLAALKSD